MEWGIEIGNEYGKGLQGRASDFDGWSNEGMMGLGQYEAEITCDGGREVEMVRESDGEIGGQEACMWRWP